MIKVITYGTYDLLHYGHIRLLERAKALGDYLIVGVTADDFDKTRGKINSQQSLMERINAVRETGLADEIIVEEYEGQKIDDIIRYDVDIFTVGSDWKGKFDYLNQYCKVVYLDRTQGISSTELRSTEAPVRFGMIGKQNIVEKFVNECGYVNGIQVSGVIINGTEQKNQLQNVRVFENFQQLIDESDAVYIVSSPCSHYEMIRYALLHEKHVLCEAPIAMKLCEYRELKALAAEHNCILMDSIKTAYSTAYFRLLLLAKSGTIGQVVSVDATCTSLQQCNHDEKDDWSSLTYWGPTALLPIFQILGNNYKDMHHFSIFSSENAKEDIFTKADFLYENAVASIKVGSGAKSEGELIISGTNGYLYVPAPWWKTDYFEARYEDPSQNKRYFYQLEGEGIRYEIVQFLKGIRNKKHYEYIDNDISEAIIRTIQAIKPVL